MSSRWLSQNVLIRFPLALLLFVSWIEGSPLFAADPRIIDYQKKLQAYYARIETLELKYTQKTTKNLNSEMLKEVAAFAEKERNEARAIRIRRDGQASREPETPPDHLEGSTITFEHLERFPSVRQTKQILYRKDGVEQTAFITNAIQNGSQYYVSSHGKIYYQSTNINLDAIERNPINAIGKRISYAINRPLSDLLLAQDATIVNDIGLDKNVVLIKCGPDFGEGRQPSGMGIGLFVLIYLNTVEPVHPVKVIYDFNATKGLRDGKPWPPEPLVEIYELSDFRDLRSETDERLILPFPRHYRHQTISAVNEWEVTSARLNPRLTGNPFVPEIPTGYAVTSPGQPEARVLKGDPNSKNTSAKMITKQARELLDQPIQESPGAFSVWPWILTVTAVVTGILLFLKSRR